MAFEDSPSSVMYAELKALGLSNHDAAIMLMRTDQRFGDGVLLDRIESRTRLSRAIVHVKPGELGDSLFKDFEQSVQSILSRLLMATGKRVTLDQVIDRLSGSAARSMEQALERYGSRSAVYRNAVAHVANLQNKSQIERASLYLMLLVVAGCTGDAARAADAVEAFADKQAGDAFHTTEAQVDYGNASAPSEPGGASDAPLFALMRIVEGKLKGSSGFYKLDPGPEGTEVGSLAGAQGSIADVDADVSRHHALIYREGAKWFIVGLQSTNGTTVISGADKMERVVEPPRKERTRGYVPQPVEIKPADTICLGASTRFMVMPMLEE